MYLKRLDVVGFKSFAERINVEFVPGVTAVVGPNGSGKSNITDAIRWVLGEQSAKSLRGAKMEDIIFAGSDSRKRLNFAEVTLTLDNEDQFLPIDYNEVSVTRRVYRSGESEYLINKQGCRLKDIVDLFMDSGLGREAFSIISQGKVEEILNSKPDDRRTIFEEAAGVLKYKTRKKKAEMKLFETQENLNRVADILHELEGQVEPLKIQASMAKDYTEKKAELEKIEVALTAHEIEEVHGSWERMSQKLEAHKAEETKMAALIQEKETAIDQLRKGIAISDEAILSMQNDLLLASEELEKLEGRKEVLKERKKNATLNRGQLEKSIKEISARISLLKKVKSEQEQAVDLLGKESARLSAGLMERQQQLKLYNEDIEEKIDSLKSDYIDLLNQQASAKNELTYIGQQLAQQTSRSSRLDAENDKFLASRDEIAGKKAEAKKRLAHTRQEVEAEVQKYLEAQRRLEALEASFEKQEKTLYQAYQYLQQARSKKEMLEEMEEEYTGFFQGVKEILKARGKKLQGIEGAVAELIKVPKKYELAMETALGGAMQHIVVANEETGRAAIQYLKQNAYGRATFLPLSVIKGKSVSPHLLQAISGHPAFVGTAVSLIGFDEKYQQIINNLLGNVVISKDLKGANEIAKILQYRSRIVTLEGDVVNPGGSMSGGAAKKNASALLSRKGELDELKQKLAEMEDKTRQLEVRVKTMKGELQSGTADLELLRRQGEELRLKEQSLKGQLREIEIEERNINDRLAVYDSEQSQFNQEKVKLKERESQLLEKIEKYQAALEKLDREIAELTNRKNTNLTSKETLAAEIGELKVELAANKEQLAYAHEKLESASAELALQQERLETAKEDLDLLSSEMTSDSSGESQLEEAARKKLEDKNRTMERISQKRDERLKMQEQLDNLNLETKELHRLHKGLAEVLKDEEVKLNRLDVELDNLIAHLREEYLLSYEGAKEQYPLTMPAEDARRKVKLIKLAIEELGTVNLGAIEEYERVSERYEFLHEQKSDLQEAKDTLFQIIAEMDTEMKKRFDETFRAVRSHFEATFQSLFGGGRADLRLTQPDDLLNTGIELVAQPPGKKLQHLGLLSGGERALTAIALLFSILKVRPVPFCILDEVEAALDEANVYRFSQYLKRYSSETQFIVITHRKGTMEEADVLYGVTMQESGVSKLVSVRLEETQELVKS
ncbi:chromosome segregation protein SMC [Mesobacillus campisalis]|uniref:Chromosome partition protein Smc n=1 Tax=Mesobacillus campisalis TaxID=1408103 RepID=A0A0M2T0T2_9BACI|nr:chromosome segregation protein SMC [Mesobacillus campisalis]KKK39596.1 chromosome segregation protein SMC [Mesobacillus campisalis]